MMDRIARLLLAVPCIMAVFYVVRWYDPAVLARFVAHLEGVLR